MTQIVDLAQREPSAFNVRDGARYVSLGETKFRELLRSGMIVSRRAGRRVIIAKAELDRFLGAP
jgi:excisionase family DNA binding protein